MESTLAGNALELATIGGLTAIIVTFITLGGTFVFRLLNRVDKLTDDLGENNARISETRTDLSEKIGQRHREVNAKIGQTHRELDEKIDHSHRELSAKIDHSHR
ncbi:MAG: hypothetical protein OXU28_05440, partial [Chloroflexota bacterium]|nr:hypothetical protein [Chloroflexota bacterium]